MPIWMFLLFLAAAMVAGLAAALLWVNVTDLKKMKPEEFKFFVYLYKTPTGLEVMLCDKYRLEESSHIYKLNQSGVYESKDGLAGPWGKKEPEREESNQ